MCYQVTFLFRINPNASSSNFLVLASTENLDFFSPNLILETTDDKSTTEPTTILGLISLGMWGITRKFVPKFN